jgi:hypothetical protein
LKSAFPDSWKELRETVDELHDDESREAVKAFKKEN